MTLPTAPTQVSLPKHTLLKVLGVIIWWRVALFVVSMIAPLVLHYDPSFPYSQELLLSRDIPQWLASWGNFDGVHYLTIVEKGYFGTGLIQAFFPLYPIVTKVLALFVNPLIAGLIISNLATVAFFTAFFTYLYHRYSPTFAWWTLLAFLTFPTVFFLGAMYTESVFLLLLFGSLWAAESKKWPLAIMFAIAASATRLVGVFLVPALMVELLQQQAETISKKNTWRGLLTLELWKSYFRFWPLILLCCLGSLGMVWYMIYLQLSFDDYLYFFHVQSEFGSGRQESLVLLPQVLWRYIKILVTYRPIGLKYFAFAQELVISLLVGATTLLAALEVRWSWLVFTVLAMLLPTLTGTLSSMPRYVLVALPMFILLGSILSHHPRWAKVWLAISSIFLVINTMMFIQGYWVA